MEVNKRIANYRNTLKSGTQEEGEHLNLAQIEEEETLVDPRQHYSMPKSSKDFKNLPKWLYENCHDPALAVSTFIL
jgi:hypothetical protein